MEKFITLAVRLGVAHNIVEHVFGRAKHLGNAADNGVENSGLWLILWLKFAQ